MEWRPLKGQHRLYAVVCGNRALGAIVRRSYRTQQYVAQVYYEDEVLGERSALHDRHAGQMWASDVMLILNEQGKEAALAFITGGE